MEVLLVEDDVRIRRLVSTSLERRSISVAGTDTLEGAFQALRHHDFDVVILDLSLPDGSGINVLDHLRRVSSTAHVIVLSGAVTELDRVRALEMGADDYVAKPFFARELTARVLAVQRRRTGDQDKVLRFDRLEIDLAARRLLVDGVVTHVTPMEFTLLAYLAVRPGHVFSRTDLLRAVWHSASDWQAASTVTEHIRRLRNKIEVDPARPRLLRTVRGAGYRFDVPISGDPRSAPTARAAAEVGVLVSVRDRIVYADAGAAAILGISGEDELLGLQLLDAVPSRESQTMLAHGGRPPSGGSPRSHVVVVPGPGGADIPVEVTAAPGEWQGQEAVRVELRHAASESVPLRYMVTGVLSEVTDAVIVTDMHGHIRSWNEAAERLYGWVESDVLGRHILDVVDWAGDDPPLGPASGQLGAADRWHGEGRQVTRDGSSIVVRASTNVVRDEAGEAIAIVSVNRHVDLDAVVHAPEPDAEDVADLRRGLDSGELHAHYQPVIALGDGRIVGVEALVRWHHPDRGILDPAFFIDTAERSGLILELRTQVLAEACSQAAAWRRDGADITIAVNLSATDLADPMIVERVTAALQTSGLDPTALSLEVTETTLVQDVEQASVRLHLLAALGIRIAIDDFGTGWASLTYLRQFPVHVLKIDRSFVTGVDHDAHNSAIVRSIVSLGFELGLDVVAEGIETAAEESALKNLGCSVGQGFLYGRATAADVLDLGRTHQIVLEPPPFIGRRTGDGRHLRPSPSQPSRACPLPASAAHASSRTAEVEVPR